MLINVAIRDYLEHAHMDEMPLGICQVIHAELPGSCSQGRCRIGFEHHPAANVIFVDRGIQYRGDNTIFRSFLRRGEFRYREDEELSSFLNELDIAVGVSGGEGRSANGRKNVTVMPITSFDGDAFKAKMAENVVGQGHVIEVLADLLTSSVRKTDPKRPLALVFAGETGVGKTLAARCMAEALTEATGTEFGTIRIDMNQLGERFQEVRFFGAPPGYIGYDDPPLFDPVRHNPHQVILFDEMEKAHPGIMLTLMNAMSDGRIESARTQKDGSNSYDLTRCILVFTTNCHFDVEEGLTQSCVTDECRKQMRDMFSTLRFPPEIIGRFSEILLFAKLGEEARRIIGELSIKRLGKEYSLDVVSVDSDFLDGFCWLCSSEGGVRNIEYMAERMFGKAFADYAASGESNTVSVQGNVFWPCIAAKQGCGTINMDVTK